MEKSEAMGSRASIPVFVPIMSLRSGALQIAAGNLPGGRQAKEYVRQHGDHEA
jgi:hypothetical protein